MSANATLTALRALGAEVTLTADSVRISAPRAVVPPAPLLAAARAGKAALRNLLEQEAAERFEERSAIIEFDGSLPRLQAEVLAAISTMSPPSGVTTSHMRLVVDAAARFLEAVALERTR